MEWAWTGHVAEETGMRISASFLPFIAAPAAGQAPDIALFKSLEGVTTFYDSVCGLPLFKAPVNRRTTGVRAPAWDQRGRRCGGGAVGQLLQY